MRERAGPHRPADRGLGALHRRDSAYFPERRFEIIPNGMDTDCTGRCADEARPAGPPRILFVGRFDPRNALDTLLDAARILADEGREFVVQVVGDGPLRSKYHPRPRPWGSTTASSGSGFSTRSGPGLPGGHRVRRPLRARLVRRGAPGGMASGTPVVCADNIGFRQVIRDGAPGARAAPGRRRAARASPSCSTNRAARADWGARGRDLAVEQYAWPTIAGGWRTSTARPPRPRRRPPLRPWA